MLHEPIASLVIVTFAYLGPTHKSIAIVKTRLTDLPKCMWIGFAKYPHLIVISCFCATGELGDAQLSPAKVLSVLCFSYLHRLNRSRKSCRFVVACLYNKIPKIWALNGFKLKEQDIW